MFQTKFNQTFTIVIVCSTILFSSRSALAFGYKSVLATITNLPQSEKAQLLEMSSSSTKVSPMTNAKKNDSQELVDAEQKDAKFWDKMAESYFKKPIDDEEAYNKKLSITREYLNPQSTVFEFGCGTGSTAILHSPYVKSIFATDISENMIEIAKKQANDKSIKNIEFEQVGIDRLVVSDASYDVVLGLNILHLMRKRDEVIKMVHKILKPGGVFISSSVCMGDFASILKYIGPVGMFFGLIPKIDVFTAEELKESLEGCGFEIDREFHPAKNKGLFLVAKKNE